MSHYSVTRHYEAIIIGGGVVGLTAALAMQQRGFSVALIDAGPLKVALESFSPRAYAINHASEHLLTSLGVWQQLEPTRLSHYQKMHVWDASSQGAIDFDTRTIARPHLGVILDENLLRNALLQALASSDVTLIADMTLNGIEETSDKILLNTQNQRFSAEWLMVADGATSPTRAHLNVALTHWSYHQHALVATVKTEKLHQQTAYQVFTPTGPLALLPLVSPHECAIVWSGPAHLTTRRLKAEREAFNQQITATFENKLGAVTLLTPRYTFPLHMRHVKQYSGARWLLMGDAAHTIHPLAGLGLNLGLADVSAWLKLLDMEPRTSCTRKILRAYQRDRKHAVWQTILLMEGIKSLFLNSLPPIAALRGLGLNLCNRFTSIKRIFIEHAAG
jgi:2-octaprenylphenol hydroxylase